ncbi:hypothetical protein TVAG_261740 [Trichomonas vaginalis G3]|uniref:Uncharacterized protein n=1 Tax=Trichomonas vaginalis (strain ATCC PRA-98 / G3) TaxID=412133 RepID=A2FQ30_TRIV3|nr:hypothetical protein TVAGG3_0684290 [Trichomonas vaginalis G3]EAX92994.1 hypothetical protein TVAG_261740 [Trichomonas vaginalis G3]KAI5508102.1 hypothetical protein TVAGG3_0684290 [Trichomonas vaginalis G3]|eukprot:XP_001305924.1 hypothetical protein [Trichomonas vaginalis G3]
MQYQAIENDEFKLRMIQNSPKFNSVTSIIEHQFDGKAPIDALMIFANLMSKKNGIILDRSAKRNRTALLCWYTENWEVIYPHISEINPLKKDLHRIAPVQSNNTINPTVDPSDLLQLLNIH